MSECIYKDAIEDLKDDCNNFLNGLIDIPTIQYKIYQTEIQILALEEKYLRELLSNVENDIEFAVFTIDNNKLHFYVKEKIEFY